MTPVLITLAALAVVYALVAWGSWWRARAELEPRSSSAVAQEIARTTSTFYAYSFQPNWTFDLADTISTSPPTINVVWDKVWDKAALRAEIALRVRDRLGEPTGYEYVFAATLADLDRLVVIEAAS